MAGYGFLGTWEIVKCSYINGTCSENLGLEGVRFRLDENGDVTWTVPEELKSLPLFNCETYEINGTSGVVIRLAAYAGHVLEFRSNQIDPGDTVVLTCECFCMLHCKRVDEGKIDHNLNIPFSLLPALEDGYFSDKILTSNNNKQFKVHSSILQLQGSDVDWDSDPPPFTNLPEEALGTILHFLYEECLPESLTETTARLVIGVVAPYPCLNPLVKLCNLFLKNMALKQQIIDLVDEMHACMNQIIEHFNPRNNPESLSTNPSKLCFIVKQCLRETAVAGAKLLLLCDLFTKRKGELSRTERHEIIRYAKSRLPIFLGQLSRFLQMLKNTFGAMSSVQRVEIATFLVPEIEVILDTLSSITVHVEKALQQIILRLSPDVSRNKSGVGDLLGKSLRNFLHLSELTKLNSLHDHIICSLRLLVNNQTAFNEMSTPEKVRSLTKNIEQLIEELPIFLIRLEEIMVAFDEKLEWREFKFCFKVGTSKVSGVLQKLVKHCDTLQDVILQLCDLVQRESFTQSLQHLGLLDAHAAASRESNPQLPSSPLSSTPKHPQAYKLNLVESLCKAPAPSSSNLSKLCLNLLQTQQNSDMEFEVVGNGADSPEEEESSIIKAHRVIVAARCDWFRRALLSGMKEDIDKKIVIHDTSPNLFTIFLEYLYSGRLKQSSFTTEQLIELLLLSDRYEVDNLKRSTEYLLQNSIDADSVLYFLSMADQYNARILKIACLSFIPQHLELTESEIFYELPISLQAEIFDCVWTHPTPHKSMERLLPTSSESPGSPRGLESPADELSDLPKEQHSNTGSLEDLRLLPQNGRLDVCVTQLRDIVGFSAPRQTLVQVILAADYDLCRAVNFYYGRVSGQD